MKLRHKLIVSAGVGTATLLAIPLLAQQRPTSGPVARYDMRAGTVSGMGAGGGMNPMAMMMGGIRGNSVQHELYLRLGSSSAAAPGAPKADHFMPPSANLSRSVALITPREERMPSEMPTGERPRGRMLIYWGCGEHAPAGQPLIIDFAKMAAGQVPPGMWTSTINRDWGPTLQNSHTFGRWPAEDGKYAKPNTSLPGAHRVVGNYSPEMNFTLSKDFMTALSMRNTAQPSGATLLNWSGIADATGYLATVFGSKMGPGGQMGDMVMWSSSASRQFGGGLTDWLTPSQVAGLVRDRTVLAPSSTSCTVPAEVKRDAPDFRMGTLTAYGPMEEFSYPPRPANPKAAWNLEWTARIRHKSSTSWMEMAGMNMGRGDDEDSSSQSGQPRPQCRPKRGLGGLLSGAMGGGGC
jgi:hypothetical protein